MGTEPAAITGSGAARLRRDNGIAAPAHLLGAVAVRGLASCFALPVTAAYLEGPPGTPASDPVAPFDIPTGVTVAGFLALSGRQGRRVGSGG